MKKFLIPLLLLFVMMVSCGDDNVDIVGDELLDSIVFVLPGSGTYGSPIRRGQYTYEWDDKSRLSYIKYQIQYVDENDYGSIEISYLSDFVITVNYFDGSRDSGHTYTIFHDGMKVDSLYYSYESWGKEPFEGISHFTYLDHEIREVRSTYYEYSQYSRIDTLIYYLTDNGNIKSFEDASVDGLVEYTYDNKRNPFANSFYGSSPQNYLSIYPILPQNNITSTQRSGKTEATISYNYLKNSLPKSASSNGITYEYHY